MGILVRFYQIIIIVLSSLSYISMNHVFENKSKLHIIRVDNIRFTYAYTKITATFGDKRLGRKRLLKALSITSAILFCSVTLTGCFKTETEKAEAKCLSGDAVSCVNAAKAYASGKDSKGNSVEKISDKSKQLFLKACTLGDGEICSSIASEFVIPNTAQTDFVAAEEFYKKACNFGYYPACGNLGLIEIKSPDLRHSYALAKDAFDKGCKGQDGKSCTYLGVMYEKVTL